LRGATILEWRQPNALALVLAPLLVGVVPDARVNESSGPLGPSSSVESSPDNRPIRISHRHLRVRACVAEADGDRRVCRPELSDADSAASLSFRLEAAPSSAEDDERRVTLIFPHQIGLQEKQLELARGRWQLTWEEASQVRRLSVGEVSLPVVELSTSSGRCEKVRDACRLVPGVLTRRISVSDEAKTALSSRL
jgi:hypothetical protein